MTTQQSIEELAKSVDLPNKKTKQVVKLLYHDVLVSLYRMKPEEGDVETNKEMNRKIEQAYLKKYGKEFDPKVHAKNKKLPLFLMGPPGQGKTASYIAAAKEVCADLGLNFVDHIEDSYRPSKKDFIMVIQECAGENSAITFGGVPRAEEVEINGEKRSVLKKALNYRFTVFEQVAGGVLLFDDAANAAQVIQNVLLPVAQNSTFQGLKIRNACIGFTGNLGALDGTYTTELSSALRTRVIPLFVTDTVHDFVNRAYEYYNDSLGDMGVINFLKRNEKDFAVLPDPSAKSGFACSRSWDNLIQSIRSVVERNGGRGVGEQESLDEVRQLAKSMVGPAIGDKLVAYFDSMIQGADPIARKMIVDNNFDLSKFKEKYSSGASAQSMSFGYQFANACGDYAVNLIAESKDPKETLPKIMERFGKAVLNLGDSEFAYALEHMKNKLATYVPTLSVVLKDETRNLQDDVRMTIAQTINNLEDCDKNKRDVLIRTITDFRSKSVV